MIIDCEKLFEFVGEKIDVDYNLDLTDFQFSNLYPFKTPVKVKGFLQNNTQIVTFVYETDFTLDLDCDRCLSNYNDAFHYDFDQIIVNSLANDTDNDDYIVIEDFKLDVDELVLSDILLNLPSKLLCDEDCQGLCPKCGVNLNDNSCDCTLKEVDPRLAVLGDLLK